MACQEAGLLAPVVGRLWSDWKRIKAPSKTTLSVPTLQCDFNAPGSDGKRQTKLPFTNVVGSAGETLGGDVVVVVLDVVGTVVVVLDVVGTVLVVVLDVVGTVVVVVVLVVVTAAVGCFSSRGK